MNGKPQTYIIAGAASGIGAALCRQLIARNCRVIAIGRTLAEPQENIIANIQHDFSHETPLPEISQPVSGLVYCPGTINLKPFRSLKDADLLNDFSVNVLGAFRFIHKYAANMKDSENASIVLFSSVAAQTGMPYHTSISVSKAGVEGLTKALAAEFSPNIRVNCVAPSLTETPLTSVLLNSDVKRTANAERHPLKRIGHADEIAAAAAFLLLDAKWTTGQVIGVNGGLGSIFK
ncbi:MAG: SDR family oxidoreductase [Flavobacterium sp.]|nr:MAG: SDR family oxidoreductase [Flavobacterium sp.]